MSTEHTGNLKAKGWLTVVGHGPIEHVTRNNERDLGF